MVASAGSRGSRVPVLAKYDVLEELGHGGMATVYRAHDKRLGRDVAVKVLHPHLRESREIAHRFSVEAKAVAKLRHPNIVEVFDVSSEEEEEQYLVVELVRGKTLRKILQEEGALPPEIGACIVAELLGAMAHAHGLGVIHRDVKPENVLLEHRPLSGAPASSAESITPPPTSEGGNRRTPHPSAGERVAVKLTDFGIAKLLDAQGVTSTGQVLGSPAHMAPEQIEGGEVDGRADVFGLGVLLYECMVGHLPFEGNNPAQVLRRVLDGIYPSAERERPIIGKTWSQILDRALARKAEARYSDAAAMRDAINAELNRLGITSTRSELEAWFDDPEGWSNEHDERLIARLCELGAESRKQGDAVAAAADYNRALAYAPNDPQILRIVSSMHRAEARMRLVRKVGPMVLAASVLGTGAFFIARAVKNNGAHEHPVPTADRPTATAPSVASSAPVVVASNVDASPPTTSATTSAATNGKPVTVVPPSSVASVPKPGTKRIVTIERVFPHFGVKMKIDGVEANEATPGGVFTLDEQAHVLSFTCRADICEPKSMSIAAGEKDETIVIELRVLPAKLIVDGDPSRSYGIEELGHMTLGSNVATDIPIPADGARVITVYDRSDPTKKQKIRLIAGKEATITFKRN